MPVRRLSPPVCISLLLGIRVAGEEVGRRAGVDPLLRQEADPVARLLVGVDQFRRLLQVVGVEQVPGRLPAELRLVLPGLAAEAPVRQLRRLAGRELADQLGGLADVVVLQLEKRLLVQLPGGRGAGASGCRSRGGCAALGWLRSSRGLALPRLAAAALAVCPASPAVLPAVRLARRFAACAACVPCRLPAFLASQPSPAAAPASSPPRRLPRGLRRPQVPATAAWRPVRSAG